MTDKQQKVAVDNYKVPAMSAMFDSAISQDAETIEVVDDILRALKRKKGFGLFFVQCNPAQGQQIIEAIKKRFYRKRIEEIKLSTESEALYGELIEKYHGQPFEIACITGVERALYDYEDTKRIGGWSRKEVYNYSWKGVPALLSHLNRQREAFEINLPVSLVFLVPGFVIDYFVQRAPDFFDWRSGFFKLSESSESLQKAMQELTDRDDKEYLSLTSEQRMAKIVEIRDTILQLDQVAYEQESDLLSEQGRLFAIEGEQIEALTCYDRALNIYPRNYRTFNNKGTLLKELERYEEALTEYERAIELEPSYYQAWKNKADMLRILGRFEEAVGSYNCVIRTQPNDHVAWHNLGKAFSRLNRHVEAINSFDQALQIKPDYQVWNNRGSALYELERYEEASESYDHALKLKSNYYALHNRGAALEKLERYEEALEVYNRAVELKPDYNHTLHNRGNILNNLKRYEEALESYDRALEIQPDFYPTWSSRGNILNNLKRYEEALESYDRALEIQPDFYPTWNSKGAMLYKLNEPMNAFECFSKVAAIRNNDEYAWNNQGYLLLVQSSYGLSPVFEKPLLVRQPQHLRVANNFLPIDLQQCRDALSFSEKAIEISPKFTLAIANKSFPLYYLERYQDALETCNLALALCQENRDEGVEVIYINKGYILLALDKHSEALESFNAAQQTDPEQSEAWIGQGTVLYKLGHYTEAAKSFDTAFALGHPLAQIKQNLIQDALSQSA